MYKSPQHHPPSYPWGLMEVGDSCRVREEDLAAYKRRLEAWRKRHAPDWRFITMQSPHDMGEPKRSWKPIFRTWRTK